MRAQPPGQLVALLERLGLATAEDLLAVRRHVRRLARDLPQFESVWIDALLHARRLTPFQAAELSAGRGPRLRVGPYLLFDRAAWPHYAEAFEARHVESDRRVLLVVHTVGQSEADALLGRLERFVELGRRAPCPGAATIDQAGHHGTRLWAAAPWNEGRSAAEWLMHRGRFPAAAVLQIARSMSTTLAALEEAGICHGDVCPGGVILSDTGDVVLRLPGLRGILRPEEGYHHAELLPEAYDCLAPERVAEGTPPTVAGDLYACGCVWWHLLCGRPPLAGGSSLARLRAVQKARIADPRRYVPEMPDCLAAALSACLKRDPRRRPGSAARLAAQLGPPTADGRRTLAAALAEARPCSGRTPAWRPGRRRTRRAPRLQRAVAVGLLAAAVAGAAWWLIGRTPEATPSGHTPSGRSRASVASSGHDESAGAGLTGRPNATGAGQPNAAGAGADGEANAAPAGAAARTAASPGEPSPGPRQAEGHAAGEPVQPHRTADGSVEPAVYHQEAAETVLEAGAVVPAASLRLQAGQKVRGQPGRRPAVRVPPEGLVLDVDRLRFENVDFVWDSRDVDSEGSGGAGDGQASRQGPALVRLQCAGAEFEGCRFRASAPGGARPVAIRWTHADQPQDAAMALPSGRLRLRNCVVSGVAAAIECRCAGARAVELVNVLAADPGALVRLVRSRGADEPLRLRLSGVTLRGGGPLLDCRYVALHDQPGEIVVTASSSVLAPSPGVPLVALVGPERPEVWLRRTRWVGQDSLVAMEAMIAAYGAPGAPVEAIDDASLTMAGLVRSRLEFAGPAGGDPSDSCLVRWQGPSRSTSPPGIDPDLLPGGAPSTSDCE